MDNSKINRAIEILKELELRKALYAELDSLIMELKGAGFESHDLGEGQTLRLVDKFAESNTGWTAAAVKRFDLVIEKPKKTKKGA